MILHSNVIDRIRAGNMENLAVVLIFPLKVPSVVLGVLMRFSYYSPHKVFLLSTPEHFAKIEDMQNIYDDFHH